MGNYLKLDRTTFRIKFSKLPFLRCKFDNRKQMWLISICSHSHWSWSIELYTAGRWQIAIKFYSTWFTLRKGPNEDTFLNELFILVYIWFIASASCHQNIQVSNVLPRGIAHFRSHSVILQWSCLLYFSLFFMPTLVVQIDTMTKFLEMGNVDPWWSVWDSYWEYLEFL